jgi:hypothetical protein
MRSAWLACQPDQGLLFGWDSQKVATEMALAVLAYNFTRVASRPDDRKRSVLGLGCVRTVLRT